MKTTAAPILNPFLSIVIPVYNGGNAFVACLQAIACSHYTGWELIVVDDGSTDESVAIAQSIATTVLSTGRNSGPAVARNLGAEVAKGEYICFIDADCEVHPDTLSKLVEVLEQYPDVDAVFGSYDDAPHATNFVAQYKNLFHHYVHQTGQEDASTFWAGCGTVKRSTFLAVGGFNGRRYPRPSIEDIDLGYRIKQWGGSIYLAKQVQVKHHKAWRLRSLIKTDILDRGIPWTQLMLRSKSGFVNDLNLKTSSRMSVVAVYLLPLLAIASIYWTGSLALTLVVVVGLLRLNLDVYQFFYHQRGVWFTLKVLPMHWLYYFYSGISFVAGSVLHGLSTRGTSWKPLWLRRLVAVQRSYIKGISKT